jgi:enamine deaminase RidA (YjgF/YER057c/UK114 family)
MPNIRWWNVSRVPTVNTVTKTISLENPPDAAPPVGPYSQVARIDLGTTTLLILSGQIGVGDDGELVPGGMREQSERIFEILRGLLAPYGASFADVVNIRTFLLDLDQLQEYGAVRRKYFDGDPPTSTTVEVSRLFRPGALLEVEVVAVVAG